MPRLSVGLMLLYFFGYLRRTFRGHVQPAFPDAALYAEQFGFRRDDFAFFLAIMLPGLFIT